MSAPNALVTANNNKNKQKNTNNAAAAPVINFSKNGATVTMNGDRLNNNNKKNNASAAPANNNKNNKNKNNNTVAAINFSKNGATVTMNGNRLNNNNKKNNAAAAPANNNKNKIGSFGPVVNPKPNNKPNNTKNPFGLVFSSNGAPKMINNPLFQANVKKYRPIKNMFTAAGKNTSGIVLNRNNNRPFGYVIPKSMVNTNPNMKVLLKNAGYKEKNNHFVHPLVGNSPNSLFVNNAPAANNNKNNNKNNAECLKLMGEYKSLLQRMKDSKCNMNGIAK